MTRRRRRSDRSGRAPLFSPGRPVAAGRDEWRRFWAAIAAGMASEDAAVQVGMSQAVGTRLFREAGGMPPAMFRPSAKPLSGRYLSFAEREEIALLRVQGCSMREVGRRLGRTASTISRELRRNAATRSGRLEYRATTAQWHAERSARRPKQAKLALNATLRTYVEERLAGVVVAADGAPVPGPAVRWKGRRHGPRKHRRWASACGASCGRRLRNPPALQRRGALDLAMQRPRSEGKQLWDRQLRNANSESERSIRLHWAVQDLISCSGKFFRWPGLNVMAPFAALNRGQSVNFGTSGDDGSCFFCFELAKAIFINRLAAWCGRHNVPLRVGRGLAAASLCRLRIPVIMNGQTVPS